MKDWKIIILLIAVALAGAIMISWYAAMVIGLIGGY